MATISKPALMFAAFYFLCGAVGPEAFPFTRVPMYSAVGKSGPRRDADVPLFLVDGRSQDIYAFDGFYSEEPTDDIIPWYHCRRDGQCKALACSMGYVPEDAARWINDHRLAEPPAEGVPVTYAYLHLTAAEGGAVERKLDVVWRGVGRRR